MYREREVAVVIPAYRAKETIVEVVEAVPEWVDHIIVVDDACPQNAGPHLLKTISDRRLTLVRHERNCGVGAATVSGYLKAIDFGCDIAVKVDSDGKMDLELLHLFVEPIA
ncbi:MAG: glycosyltransferase, partial [Pseudomonadota bacterium]